MAEQATLLWEGGPSSAPPPPLVDLAAIPQGENPLAALYRIYGPAFRLPQPGQEPRTFLAGPAINVFMARHEDEFFSTQQQWRKFDAAITQNRSTTYNEARDGQANRERRIRDSRYWSRMRVIDQVPRMTEIILACTQDWQTGSSIPVHRGMRRLVAEQLGQLLIGASPAEYLEDFVTYLDATFVNTHPLGKSSSGPDLSAYERASARVAEFSRKVYEAHLSNPRPNGRPDMIDDAIAETEQLPDESRKAMLELVALGPMLTGIDTVANALSFIVYALLANPGVLQRVRAEIAAARREGPLDWEKLKKMPDLHGAIMESLRLYPVAGGHITAVAHPLTIGGYRLEPDSEVYVAMTVPHYLEELYPHPFQFDLERFRPPRNEHRQSGAYAPFGLGNHTCLGAGIAEVQLMITIATLLSLADFQFDPPDYQLVIENRPNPMPGNNFKVRVIERRPFALH